MGLKGTRPEAYPEKKYHESLRIKNPNKTRDMLLGIAAIGVGLLIIKLLKNQRTT